MREGGRICGTLQYNTIESTNHVQTTATRPPMWPGYEAKDFGYQYCHTPISNQQIHVAVHKPLTKV